MEFNLVFILAAIGFALVMEGMAYFIFAGSLPKFLRQLADAGAGVLRIAGLVVMILGVLLIWVVTTYPSFF